MADITQAEEQKPEKSTSKQQQKAATQLADSPPQQEKGTSLSSTARSGQDKVSGPCPPLKLKKRKKTLTQGPLPGQLLPPITTSPEREEGEVKSENKSLLAPTSMTGLLLLRHQRPITKLDPSRLPQNYVVPQYVVFDTRPIISQKPSGKPSQSEPVSKPRIETATSSSDDSGTFPKRDGADVRLDHKYGRRKEKMSSSRPLDKMNIAKGALLLDSSADEKSYLQSKLLGLATKLNPIQSDAAAPLYSVEQVIAGPPQVTPLSQHQN